MSTTEKEAKHNNTLRCAVTIEEAISSVVGQGKWQRWLLIISGMSQFADACELMLLAFLGGNLLYEETDWGLDSFHVAFLSTSVFMGMLLGALLTGLISDTYGRRIGSIFTSAFVAIFGITSSLSPNFSFLVCTRFLVGVGVGGSSAALSLFAEFIVTKDRTRETLKFLTFFSLGAILEVLIAWGTQGHGWRLFLLISSLPAVITLILFIFYLPESPRFLISRRKFSEVRKVLQEAARMNGKFVDAKWMLNEENWMFSTSNHNTSQMIPMLFVSKLRKSTIIICSLYFQMAFLYYGLVIISVIIFEKESSHIDFLPILIANFAELPGLFISSLMLDRFGRRVTLSVLFLCFAITVPFLAISPSSFVKSCLLFCCRSFALGFNQSLWIYTTEVYPTTLRTTGLGFASSFARVGGALSPLIAQVLFVESKALSLLTISCVALFSSLLSLYLPYETNHRHLAESLQV